LHSAAEEAPTEVVAEGSTGAGLAVGAFTEVAAEGSTGAALAVEAFTEVATGAPT